MKVSASLNIDWPEAKIFNTKKYKRARSEGHNALFWLARGAHSFLVPCDNDTHLDLSWHEETKSFRTKIFDRDLQIGLYLPDLELYFCENDVKVPHSFWMDDRTPAYVEAWYLVELVHRDRDREKFSTDLPFSSPNLLMGDTEDHNASAFKEELNALDQCFQKTIQLFKEVADVLSKSGHVNEKSKLLVLKPEAFALVLSFQLKDIPEVAISVGLSAGDNLRPSPFFFTGSSSQDEIKNNHVLDYDAETLISYGSVQKDQLSDRSLIDRLSANALSLIRS